jgi:hypothetical protein
MDCRLSLIVAGSTSSLALKLDLRLDMDMLLVLLLLLLLLSIGCFSMVLFSTGVLSAVTSASLRRPDCPFLSTATKLVRTLERGRGSPWLPIIMKRSQH